jgi:hypothetical protein
MVVRQAGKVRSDSKQHHGGRAEREPPPFDPWNSRVDSWNYRAHLDFPRLIDSERIILWQIRTSTSDAAHCTHWHERTQSDRVQFVTT